MSIYCLEVLRFSKTRDCQAMIWITQLYLILDQLFYFLEDKTRYTNTYLICLVWGLCE